MEFEHRNSIVSKIPRRRSIIRSKRPSIAQPLKSPNKMISERKTMASSKMETGFSRRERSTGFGFRLSTRSFSKKNTSLNTSYDEELKRKRDDAPISNSLKKKSLEDDIVNSMNLNHHSKRRFKKLIEKGYLGIIEALRDFPKNYTPNSSYTKFFSEIEFLHNKEFERRSYLQNLLVSLAQINDDIGRLEHIPHENTEKEFRSIALGLLSPKLIAVLIFFKSEQLLATNHHVDAIKLSNIGITLCYLNELDYLMMLLFFLQGEVYENAKQYMNSLEKFTKALQYSWNCKDKYRELRIYDKIAICYYYLENMRMAEVFHQRMVDGYLEPEASESMLQSIEQLRKERDSVIEELGLPTRYQLHAYVSAVQLVSKKIRPMKKVEHLNGEHWFFGFHDTIVKTQENLIQFINGAKLAGSNSEKQEIPSFYKRKVDHIRRTFVQPFVQTKFTRNGEYTMMKKMGLVQGFDMDRNYVKGVVYLNKIKLNSIIIRPHESDKKTLLHFLNENTKNRKKDAHSKVFKEIKTSRPQRKKQTQTKGFKLFGVYRTIKKEIDAFHLVIRSRIELLLATPVHLQNQRRTSIAIYK